MERISSPYESGRRYSSLRVIGFLYALIGVILLVLGAVLLVFGLWTLTQPGAVAPPQDPSVMVDSTQVVIATRIIRLGGVVSLLWSCGLLLSGIHLISLGGLFRLMIDVEENTRVAAQTLDRIRSSMEPNGNDDAPLFRS
jgi:hypothetical protein